MSLTHRYLIHVSYIGTAFRGSQRLTPKGQPIIKPLTVQEAVDAALGELKPKDEVKTTSSSRTDRGVHAIHNCFTASLMHMCKDNIFKPDDILYSCNHYMATNDHLIRFSKVQVVRTEFHPQSDIASREYRYRIALVRNLPQGFCDQKMLRNNPRAHDFKLLSLLPISEMYRVMPVVRLDLDKLNQALELFRGEHDFASFTRRISKKVKTKGTIRTLDIDFSKLSCSGAPDIEHFDNLEIYEIRFKSTSFLYNQIIRLVGIILAYACQHVLSFEDIQKLMNNPSPASYPPKVKVAKPWGLYLYRLNFKENFKDFDITDNYKEIIGDLRSQVSDKLTDAG